MKGLIVSGGNPPTKELILKYSNYDFIIAADRGGEYLLDKGILPHFLIGDFDSLNKEKLKLLKEKGCTIFEYPSKKDFTDTEACLDKAMDLGCDKIVILGGIGTRVDHNFSNINLLYKAYLNNISCTIEDENNIIFVSKAPVFLEKKDRRYFSVFPYLSELKNLNIYGAKYELRDYHLQKNETITVSNEFKDEVVKMDFDGIALVVESND